MLHREYSHVIAVSNVKSQAITIRRLTERRLSVCQELKYTYINGDLYRRGFDIWVHLMPFSRYLATKGGIKVLHECLPLI